MTYVQTWVSFLRLLIVQSPHYALTWPVICLFGGGLSSSSSSDVYCTFGGVFCFSHCQLDIWGGETLYIHFSISCDCLSGVVDLEQSTFSGTGDLIYVGVNLDDLFSSIGEQGLQSTGL